MRIEPSPGVIGAKIHDVELAQALSAADFDRIEVAFNAHAVIAFPRQHLDEAQLIAFARRWRSSRNSPSASSNRASGTRTAGRCATFSCGTTARCNTSRPSTTNGRGIAASCTG